MADDVLLTNEDIHRRFVEGVNNGSMDPDLFAADFIYYDPAGNPSDLAYAQEQLDIYKAAFPDLHVVIDDLTVTETRAISRFTSAGTHTNDLMGIPPSGKSYKIIGVTILHIADGKITEHWEAGDILGMFQQLGVIPSFG